ncbi:MAG TPA: hypothetical protein VHK86_07300, partial [Nitrososphaera sp.]|nr:hypothetical protein [Nitrososphaera sp.]
MSTPQSIDSYYVKGKTIYINFKNPLSLGQKYTLTIKTVSDTQGDEITNKILQFTPKNIAFKDLPSDQQAAILRKKPQKADQNHAPSFSGMQAFLDNGLTTNQVDGLIEAFTKFSSAAKNIAIDSGSLSPGPHDPNSVQPFTTNFIVRIDNATYKGVASYSDLDSIRLLLFNPANNAQVYDSGTIRP